MEKWRIREGIWIEINLVFLVNGVIEFPINVWFLPPIWVETFVAVGCSSCICEPYQHYDFSVLICSVYNNIHHPGKLAVGADFYCFKHNIEPKWEEPICANGGKWTVTYSRGKSDTCWLYTVCFKPSLLSEMISSSSYVYFLFSVYWIYALVLFLDSF